MSKKVILSLLMFALIAGLVTACLYAWLFPYGYSHCCDKQLMGALEEYAKDHNGQFPTGGVTPEGSLSKLYPKYADANLLRGKTVSETVVRGILERGGELGPDTCGWHYNEGFTLNDNPEIALFWDKVGLGHNGQRLRDGGHTVFFVDSTSAYIPGDKWEAFLEEQRALRDFRPQRSKSPTRDKAK